MHAPAGQRHRAIDEKITLLGGCGAA